MNKKAIYDTKNEIHFYKDEMVLNITQTPFQLVKIIDIDHINGKMSVKPYKKKTHLEQIEDIEILRFFDHGIKIKMVKLNSNSVAVDEIKDVKKAEKILKKKLKK